ncbi:hypothetical protein [Steroidobacter cummioxidans]|uniref:hypothetical protein n=1 Tax=Steroidobacter cummioxidans TaxID=1803913 RepID=UPI000E3183D8|nr:hypothetical protein [Steroidobacter cummioxidans]
MNYRDPIVVIDETIDNLVYLVEWWLEDLDVAVARDFDLLTWDDARTISALRATRCVAALPRLRIVRSNYESSPSLPGAKNYPRDRAMDEFCERNRIELRRLLYPPGDGAPPAT